MSCLFDSLARGIWKKNGAELRREICDYLDSGVEIDGSSVDNLTIWTEDMNKRDYIHRMRQNNTFGGALEIKAFCNMYKKNVKVDSLPNHKEIEFIGNADDNSWIVLTWNGGHYEFVKTYFLNEI